MDGAAITLVKKEWRGYMPAFSIFPGTFALKTNIWYDFAYYVANISVTKIDYTSISNRFPRVNIVP
jgi:hypothetical protein